MGGKETVLIIEEVFKGENREERQKSIEKLFLEIIRKSKDKIKI